MYQSHDLGVAGASLYCYRDKLVAANLALTLDVPSFFPSVL